MKKTVIFVSALCVLAMGSLLVSCSKNGDVSKLPSSCYCTVKGDIEDSGTISKSQMRTILEDNDLAASSCPQFGEAYAKYYKKMLKEEGWEDAKIKVTCEQID